MAREGIRGELFAAVRKATTQKKVVSQTDLHVKDNGGFRIASDIGRPISDIAMNISYKNLTDDAQQVLKDLKNMEKELHTKDGATYLMRMSPYRTVDDVVDGVAITFVNIDTQKRLSEKVQSLGEALENADNLFNTVREPLIALDDELRVIHANKSLYRIFRVTDKETEGKYIYDRGNGQWNIPELRKLLDEIIPKTKYSRISRWNTTSRESAAKN